MLWPESYKYKNSRIGEVLMKLKSVLDMVANLQLWYNDKITELAATAKNMETASVIKELNSVSDITSTIKKISQQSNILGINASIESARAGEQGRGFAVVAEEVRKLADTTKGSAAGIEEDIARVQDSIAVLIE
ncbi:MAG: methyl-accepting chemotaxis protein [Desulfitobacteriaceae bacterium]